MNKQKLCVEHGHILGKKVKWELVKPDKCNFCRLENAFNTVLDMKEFRDLRP